MRQVGCKEGFSMTVDSKKRVYCSGPLFCTEEIREMEEIAGALERAGYDTFLPHRDGLEAFIMKPVNATLTGLFMLTPVSRWVNRAAFALDIYQVVEGCDCFVFNMNGRVPDEGGVVETAVALGTGKPVVIYENDPRRLSGYPADPMLYGAALASPAVDDIERIGEVMEREVVAASVRESKPASREGLPPFVRDVLRLGRTVWRFRRLYGLFRPRNELVA